MSKRTRTDGVIAFVCSEADEGSLKIPAHLRSLIVVSNEADKFDPEKIQCVVWKPPGKPQTVEELFKRVEKAQGKPPAWFHSFFAGVDGLGTFLKHLDQTKTKTTNGRGAFSSSLAEFNVAAMLHFNKQINRLQQNYNAKRWEMFNMPEILGKTVGFLGFGSIAQATARLMVPWGVNMIATKRSAKHGDKGEFGVTFVSKEECAQQSDFIVNALPATPDTKDFANAAFFAKMKPSAIFINVGRGSTVDEEALADALESKRIGGAALDVFKKEPLPKESRLYTTPNTLLSNHNADHTDDYIELGWKVFEENLVCFEHNFEHIESLPKPTFFDPRIGY